ncbi:MAG: serine hydrolase domain-containing protein [Limisphaerales bacterium]
MKYFVLIFLFRFLPICSLADRVDDFVRSEMDKRQIPGVSLTILQRGHEIKTAAYGFANLELKAPVTKETVFEIGSITKQFTAGGILVLAQEGKLSVDDFLSKHLQDTPKSWSEIRLRHLLTHTSGIKSYTGLDGFELTKHLKQAQFIKAIGLHPLEFAPGESWKYCNTGFNLLGFVIENVSGKNYWDFMGEKFFGPLGMTATTNREPSLLIAHRADGYEKKNNILINRDYDLTDVFAAGAIVSTTGDLAKWSVALDSEKFLSAASKTQMWTPVKLNNGQTHAYGFGWFLASLQGRKNIGHSGSTSGFSASLQRFPDDQLTIILLTNSDESDIATVLAKQIAALYFTEPTK